jgi:hypothetical protein
VIADVLAVPYGRPATEALARVVAGAKAGAPLAPVTVVVPSNLAGLTARRLLGSGELGVAGVANVSFVTAFRLAELLAADQLLDTRPLTNPVLGAAVRSALAADPGPFRPVATHPATEAALVSLYAEVSNLGASDRSAVARTSVRAAQMIRQIEAVAGRLDGFHDEAAVARSASDRPRLAQALEPFGTCIWYLPGPLHQPLVHLLSIVLTLAPSTVIVGLTGADDADEAVFEVCRRAGVRVTSDMPSGMAAPPSADHLVSVTDADEEVRQVVRRVVAALDDGARLDRVGVFYPVAEPYVALLERQFDAAGIPANGPSRSKLSTSASGRTLLAALALPGEQWRRDRVMALVAGAPLVHDAARVRPTAWERVSRRAGVVAHLDGWRTQLDRYATACRARVAENDPTASAGAGRLEADARESEALRCFVETLADAVGRVREADGWAGRAASARSLLDQLLGGASRRRSWPEPEQQAHDRVEAALDRLAELDEIEPGPSFEVFVRALQAELDVHRGRSGRFGRGVLYGPLVAAPGLDLDAVFVVGCAEGLLPVPRREDSLLPDAAREAGGLPSRAGRLGDQHRALLAALAAAPPGRRTMLFPRGSLRGGRQALPSRWLLDSAGVLAGRPVAATTFPELQEPVLHTVASFTAGLRGPTPPAGLADRDLRALLTSVDAGVAAAAHPLAHLALRGFDAQAARRSERFTEWDGNVAGHAVALPADRTLSPSRLETWAACGFRYYLAYLLGLDERNDPERIIDIAPADRGSAMHEVLERFIGELPPAVPGEPVRPWTAAQRARAHEIAGSVFDDYEAKGLTGRSLLWRLSRELLRAQLDRFLDHDDGHRLGTGARPEHAEWSFGLPDSTVGPVRITRADGTELQLGGRVDRVDVTADGRVVVFDYKAGRPDRYRKIDRGDPVGKGTMLQLGLYAEAAVQHLGAASAEAWYWLLAADKAPLSGYAWTDERRRRFVEVVDAIADGIAAGIFPVDPGVRTPFFGTYETCRYCAFEQICPGDRGEMADAKRGDPALAVRAVLAGSGEEEP